MSTSIMNIFSLDFKTIIIDEIALSGLEGIGFDFLWKCIEKRLSCKLTPKIKDKFWKFIVKEHCISFYLLRSPIPNLEVQNRFHVIQEETGQLIDPPDYLDGPYEYCPIKDEYGSCPSFKSRKQITDDSLDKPYEEVFELHGDFLVMVASLEERWRALAPQIPISTLSSLSSIHYCILELIGRGRENGQMTVGRTNLSKIVKESKHLFYNRNHLQQLNLVKVQCVTQILGNKGMKSLLLRLTRFHLPYLLTQPQRGKIHDKIEYLRQQPNYCATMDEMFRLGLLTPPESKRLQKTVNIFKFEERETDSKIKKSKSTVKKKYVSLQYVSEESSGSEEESSTAPVKCQYKVGVNILRQAYECFLEAGLKGLTQIEVAQLVGVEFYTCRTICRILKARGLVREFLEDKGRQRMARYIAVAATNEIDMKFAAEKKKLMEYLNTNKRKCEKTVSDVPKKKLKLEKDNLETKPSDDIDGKIIPVTIVDGIEERKYDSLFETKKKPTLRQLKFATGILKVVNERKFITGYQTLSTLVSQETGEPPMDTKSLKHFIQKLLIDGQLKIYKLIVKVFEKEKNILYICPASTMPDDPLLKAKYKEHCVKSKQNYKKPRAQVDITRPWTNYTYPRYLKIQKLHEYIINLTYFNDAKSSFHSGFGSLYDIIPEMTVEFAMGNITFVSAIYNVGNLKISDAILEHKLKDAPENIRTLILNSKSLHNSLRDGLKILAVMGLIQLISDPTIGDSEKGSYLNYVFYVNHRSKIIDTTGCWPRGNTATLEKSFYFKTLDDVTNYWEEVQRISLSTTITGVQRDRIKFVQPIRNQKDVLIHDIGYRFGDGNGPCGFDSSLFMDMARFWRTYSSRNTNPRVMKMLRSRIKTEKGQKSTKEEQKKLKKRKGKSSVPKTIVVKPKQVKKKLKRSSKSDPSVKWTKQDDEILTMLKVVMAIMTPVPGCIKVRNNVAKIILSVNDPKKIASLCHRRSLHLENKPALTHEKLCVLNELRRHRSLIEKYEGLFKVLRLRHFGNFPKFIQESKLHVLELLWIAMQMAKKKPFIQRIPSVASSLEEFNENYTISSSAVHKCLSSYITPLDSDPSLAALKEGVILTIMLSLDKEVDSEVSQKIYEIYKRYPERNLRATIEDLRKCGALSAKEKILNGHLNKIHFNDIVQSSYKISFVYKRRWQNRLSSHFDESFRDIIETEIPQNGLKGSSVFNCLLFEMQACDHLDIISITVPVISGTAGSLIEEEKMNVIDIEAKYKLKSGMVGWTDISNLKNFSNLWKHIDVKALWASLASDSVVDVSENQDTSIQNAIIDCLKVSEHNGCTFRELKNATGIEYDMLRDKLTELESENVIKLIGYFDNRIVLRKFIKPWLFQSKSDTFIVPAPWLNLDGAVQYDIFLKWASAIMNKVFESPGASIEFLSMVFEFISIRSLLEVVTFLEKSGCITLKCIKPIEVDLFSDDYTMPELKDYNPYESQNCILAFPMKDSITKFVYLKKKILETVCII